MSPRKPDLEQRDISHKHGSEDRASTPTAEDTRLGSLAAASAAVLFGSAIVATSFQLRAFTPTSAAMWRGAVGALFLVALIWVRQTRARQAGEPDEADRPTHWGRRSRLILLGALGGPLFIVGLNIAVSEIGATVTGFVVALYTTFSAAIAPLLLKEPLRGRALVGLASALVGTALLSELSLEETNVPGMAAGLGAAVSYAFYLVLGRRWSRPFNIQPQRIALSAALMTAFVVLVWLVFIDRDVILPNEWRIDALAALIWLGFVMGIGQALVMASARRVHARTSASLLLLNPITAAVLGVTVLGENLAPIQVMGGLLVLAGMALASGLFTLVRDKLTRTDTEGQSPPAAGSRQ